MIRISPELSILLVGRILLVVVALASIKIATHYLSPSEIGNLYLVISMASFFGLFLINPVGQYVNRKTFQWHDEKNILNVYYLYNYYIILITLISPLVLLLFIRYGIASGIDTLYLFVSVASYVYFVAWNQTIIPMINMLGNRIMFVIFTTLSQMLFVLLAFLLVSSFGREGVIWFFGKVLAFGVMAIISLLYFYRNIQKDFSMHDAHRMVNVKNISGVLSFAMPLSVSVLFMWLQTQSYSIIIERNIGSEFLGYFGVGMAIAMSISGAFETVISQFIHPRMYRSMHDEKGFEKEMQSLTNILIPIYLSMAIFVTIFSEYIMVILVDKKYQESFVFLNYGIWFAFFRISGNMLSNIAHAKMETANLILPLFVGSMVSVCGVAYATMIDNYILWVPLMLVLSSITTFALMYYKMNALVHIRMDHINYGLAILYSIPLLLIYTIDNHTDDVSSLNALLVLAGFGCYYLYIVYRLSDIQR